MIIGGIMAAIRTTTLETALKQCQQGFARRVGLLEDAVSHTRLAATHVSRAEYELSLSSLKVQEFMSVLGTGQMRKDAESLQCLFTDIESQIRYLGGERAKIESGYETPTRKVVALMHDFSIASIKSVLGPVIQMAGGEPSGARTQEMGIDFQTNPHHDIARPEAPRIKSLALSDLESDASLDMLVNAVLDQYRKSGALLFGSLEHLEAAQQHLGEASASLVVAGENYVSVRDSITSSDGAMDPAKETLGMLVEGTIAGIKSLQAARTAGEQTGRTAQSAILGVLKSMEALLASELGLAIIPSTARELLIKPAVRITDAEVVQRVLSDDIGVVKQFVQSGGDVDTLSQDLYNGANPENTDAVLNVVKVLKALAQAGDGQTSVPLEKLQSLSSPMYPNDVIRAAATAALAELSVPSGASQ